IITNREDEDNEIFNYKSFGTTVAYDFYSWSYGEGSYTVYVRSNGDGINYTNSAYASKRYDFGLKSVNISFNSSSSELTWEEGSDLYPCAEDYDLYIYDAEDYTALSEPIISIEATTATGFDMSSFQAGAYYVRIVSNRSRFTSVTATYSLFKTRLAAPDAVIAAADEEFSSIQLQWNEVKNATSYIITIGSNNYITSALSFTWQKDTYYFESSSQFDFTSDTNLIAVRAFDDNHDYFVSAPTELAAGRDALVDISVSGEQDGVTVSGELYEYNEAPFTVTIDYLSNLYAYDTAKTLKNYFKLYYSKNGTLYSSLEDNYAPSKMLRTQSITEESGLELPEYFRLCFVPNT
ncbi:MAG: hypothetical protein K2I79_03650, partial [Clostridia bacterium]|nr:hypothetical protein [Clostridia bacterium]